MNFEEAYKLADQCSHETAFRKDEAQKYYELLSGLPEGSNVVEIGIEFGRSTTIAGYVSKYHKLNQVSIDNWSGEYGKVAHQFVNGFKDLHGLNYAIWSGDSSNLSKDYKDQIDLLFIDGDHSYTGVIKDCTNWIPKVKRNGLVLFHDFGRDSLPEVYQAVQEELKLNRLEFITQVYTLGVFKKL